MKTILLTLFSILVILFIEGCYYDKAELLYPDSNLPCDTTSATAKFSTDVLPVMNASCNLSGCHNSTDASSGVILDNYAGVRTQALNGRLMGSTSSTGTMPKNAARLSSCTLAKIQQWINSSTPNN
jgi:cytochrome c553